MFTSFKLQSVFGILLAIFLASCSSSSPKNTYSSSDEKKPIVDDKYRLTADREKFAEARSQIPQDKKVENDELALVFQLMEDPSREPSRVREKFDSLLSKRREKYSKDAQKERDEFTKKEHKDREDFLKNMADDRKEFMRSKHSKEEREEFFNKQDEQRREAFENIKEKRSDFESDVTARRKDFEDYAREKASDFRQEYVGFQHRHEDFLKNKEKQKKEAETHASPSGETKAAEPEVKSFLQEFMDIPAAPGTHLESGD